MTEIKIFPHLHDLFLSAAEDFTRRAIDAINTKNEFTVALAGGNTPKSFFDVLTGIEFYNKKIPWQLIQFYFTDERYVSFDDAESNYHMAYEHLFSKVPIPSENIYRIATEYGDPKDAAQAYALSLRKSFCINNNEYPKFDLIYLGLGEDAHTASLMPFSDVVINYSDPEKMNLENKYQLVAALWVAQLNMYRITLTPPVISNAENIVFLVTGANKASAVSAVLEGPFEPQRYPAQLINGAPGEKTWYIDQAAAGQYRGAKES